MTGAPSPSGIVTLLTDFGLRDSYVGQMKGALLGVAPQLQLVDLTHLIPPQDVLEGAFQLATAWEAFPPGTVHLVVVDPGVGTARQAIAVAWAGHSFVLPNNGLLTLVRRPSDGAQAVQLDPASVSDRALSRTFHGRDLFAPAAARLATGTPLASLGTVLEPGALVVLPELAEPVLREPGRVSGPIVSIDHFGNCRTLIPPDALPNTPDAVVIRVGARALRGVRGTYGDVPPLAPVALFGSHGGLEIAIRDDSAAERLGLRRGDRIEVLAAPG